MLIKDHKDQDKDIAFIIAIIGENIDNKPKITVFENQIPNALYYVYEDLRLVNDILYKNSEDKDGNQEMKYVLPESLIQTAVHQLHQTTMAGHLGLKRTLKRVFHRYYRPFLKETVTRCIRECDSCQKIKNTQPKRKAKLILILPNKPGKLVTFDCAGPFIVTARGNKYLIVIIDHFTKFVAIYALKDMTTETIADVLVDYMCKYGLVESVLSDLGTNFMSPGV